MICRRCGMESSTTDTCEWCKKPMLPPGGAISTKAKEELIKQREEAAKHPPEQQISVAAPPESEDEAAIRRPESKPPPPPPEVHPSGLLTLGAHFGAEVEAEAQPAQAPNYVAGGESENTELLRPLGALGTTAAGDEGQDSTLYVGNDEDILRPIERPLTKDGVKYTIDATGRKRRVVDETPEVPDKVRLFRGAIQGSLVAVVMAIVQFLVTKQVPNKMVVLSIGDAKSFAGALQFGIYSAILMGFMLAALLVNFKKGPVAGFLIGLVLGYTSVAMADNQNMPWPLITAVICGVVVGRMAVKGLKRVVNV